ncbi:MAG TPA: hypothetical protein PLG73_15810 [Candidatus Sumerlaeota bacterium]|nr:hypothetical protein [Candidatus Sumerlaeota bacterium]
MAAWLLALALGAGAQEAAAPADESEAVLNLENEPGGLVAPYQSFLYLIHRYFPDASGRWDPASEVMRLHIKDLEIEVPAARPEVIVNGEVRRVERSLILRQGEVKVPLATVELILRELDVPYEFAPGEGEEPAARRAEPPPVPTDLIETTPETTPEATPEEPPRPARDDAAVSPPAVEITPAPEPELVNPPAVLLPSDETAAPAPIQREEAMALQPPPALAGKIGLTWAQLTDLDHRRPPRRVTLAFDDGLADLAGRVEQKLRDGLGLVVTRVPIGAGRRSSDVLASQINGSRPELFLDLVANPVLPEQAPGSQPLIVWVVNEALWPNDRGQPPGEAGSIHAYLRHEFQSLALGSLLRNALGQQSGAAEGVQYELAPSYLLRRVDSASAAVLVPLGEAREDEANRMELIARGIQAAVEGYTRGMSQAQF